MEPTPLTRCDFVRAGEYIETSADTSADRAPSEARSTPYCEKQRWEKLITSSAVAPPANAERRFSTATWFALADAAELLRRSPHEETSGPYPVTGKPLLRRCVRSSPLPAA